MKKHCKGCEEEKPLSDFGPNGKYTKNFCRPCSAARRASQYRTVIEEFYGGWKCKDCGFEGHPAQFDCHHRDPAEKVFAISTLRDKAINERAVVEEELAKCDLLCANCHRLRHVKT